MDTDRELAKRLTELRDVAEYVEMLVRAPQTGPAHERDEKTGEMVEVEPYTDTWRLARNATLERLLEGASELAAAANDVQDWFDAHGDREDLKNPYRSPGGWVGYVPLDGKRSWRSRLWRSWAHLRRAAT